MVSDTPTPSYKLASQLIRLFREGAGQEDSLVSSPLTLRASLLSEVPLPLDIQANRLVSHLICYLELSSGILSLLCHSPYRLVALNSCWRNVGGSFEEMSWQDNL